MNHNSFAYVYIYALCAHAYSLLFSALLAAFMLCVMHSFHLQLNENCVPTRERVLEPRTNRDFSFNAAVCLSLSTLPLWGWIDAFMLHF
jgi:hypothetical protein